MTKKTRRAKARRALLSISLVLVMMMAAVGGTIAWLTDSTDAVENTFTVGNIDIDLTETANNANNDGWTAELIPSKTYPKDPKVIVKAGSEKCYLFVQATVTNNTFTLDGETKNYLTFTMFKDEMDSEGNLVWTLVEDTTDVWYRIVDVSNSTTDFTCDLLTGNTVTVNPDLTNQTMPTSENAPKLTFRAYAVQVEGRTVTEAWTTAKDTKNVEYATGASATPWLAPTPTPATGN